MKLDGLMIIKGNKRPSKRIGRGRGSGKGMHTVGRGNKGQKARNTVPLGFEGGQSPLYKRLPRLGGFVPRRRRTPTIVDLSKFNIFDDGAQVTPDSLMEKGIIRRITKHGVKILSDGKLEKKIVLKGFLFTSSAKKKIEQAGGNILDV